MKIARNAVREIGDRVEGAVPRAALILAHLLHDHQQTMAAAYPRAVIVSGFLGDEPEVTVTERLQDVIGRTYSFFNPDVSVETALEPFLDAFSAAYDKFKPTPAPATRNGWIENARSDELVVGYNSTGTPRLTINGRAPAPTGVAGMGSHTTAWVVETMAVNALVADTRTDAEAITALGRAVKIDLQSQLMALDRLLPADQIEGGQIYDIFNAARTVLEATDASEAATAYLCFRNLLPFATVDAGDRGGHGERSTGRSVKNFDGDSLYDAASLQQDALNDRDTRLATAAALRDAAKALQGEDWGADKALLKGVSTTAARLVAQASLLESGAPKDVIKTIVDTRTAEHREVSKLAVSK